MDGKRGVLGKNAKRGHFRVAYCLFLRFRSHENVFLQQVHFHANQTHFHMKGFAEGLVLKQRHKITLASLIWSCSNQ